MAVGCGIKVKSKTTDKMKTGQRVLCIDAAGTTQPVEEGQDYVVKATHCCRGCGELCINVGFKSPVPTTFGCRNCGYRETITDGLYWSRAQRFVPLQENWTDETITEALKKQITGNNGLHFSQIIG